MDDEHLTYSNLLSTFVNALLHDIIGLFTCWTSLTIAAQNKCVDARLSGTMER